MVAVALRFGERPEVAVVVSLLAGMGARWFMIAASKMIARLRK